MENKRFLKIFDTQEAYELEKDDQMGIPHTVLFRNTNNIFIQRKTLEKKYFTIEALEDGYFNIMPPSQLKYKFNNNLWVTTSENISLEMKKGDTVQLSCVNTSFASTNNNLIFKNVTFQFNVYGNIMSLLNGDNFINNSNWSQSTSNATFFSLFTSSKIKSANKLILPNTVIDSCYQNMFAFCENLNEAPELKATILAPSCYSHMFRGCISLMEAPELKSQTLTEHCYGYMFDGCSNLNYIKMLATDISATECLTDWVEGVAEEGIFIQTKGVNIPNGNAGIPIGWVVLTNDVYKMVDLGLPSGIKWANLNIGAESETDSGLFFQWGDTQGWTKEQSQNGEKIFNGTTYPFNTSSHNVLYPSELIKYNPEDGKIILDLEDDAAHVHMGGSWHMPSGTNCEELVNNTNYEWITINGINGAKFTNKTDSSKYIFLPDGFFEESDFNLGTGTVWSSSLNETYLINAMSLYGKDNNKGVDKFTRSSGLPIRGIIG